MSSMISIEGSEIKHTLQTLRYRGVYRTFRERDHLKIPWRGSDNNIKIHLTEKGCMGVDWFHLTQGRD